MKIQSSYRVVGDDTDGVVGLNDVGPIRNRTVGAGVRRRGQKSNLAGNRICLSLHCFDQREWMS